MDTLVLNGSCPEDIQRAGDILRRGGLVAIPTETVYGWPPTPWTARL